MSKNQTAKLATTADTYQLLAIANCLLDYVAVHGKSAQIYGVLQFLAQETLRNIETGKGTRFNYFSIRSGVTGETQGDASAWFSRHWKAFTGEFRSKCEEGIQKFAADRGLDVYPWIEKLESDGGAGNQALISLIALPLPGNQKSSDAEFVIQRYDIAYIPAEKLELSWWAKWLFDENRVARGWRKSMLIWPPLIWLLITSLGAVLLLYVMGRNAAPVTNQDLIILTYIGLLAWYASHLIKRFVRLVYDRLLMASESMIGFREFGVCLELFKSDEVTSDKPKSARMIKYAAQCPTCGAQVLLDAGEPDFPRRIVGRCQESPREHVFSFDRATRTGYRLR